jgi:hypothetical protein
MWLTDPKTGEKSVTLTLLVLVFIIATFKLLFASATLFGITFSSFGGIDFGATLSSVSVIYAYRKKTDATPPTHQK